jgi:hypothetical protein
LEITDKKFSKFAQRKEMKNTHKEYVLKNEHCEIHTTIIAPLTSTYEQRHVPT